MSFMTMAAGGGNPYMAAASMFLSYGSYKVSKIQANQVLQQGNFNAQLMEFDAERILSASLDKMRVRTDDAIRDLGEQRARMGASGVSIGEGSPLLQFANTIDKAEQDIHNIKEQAETDAWRTRMGAKFEVLESMRESTAIRTKAKGRLTQTGLTYAGRMMGGKKTTPMKPGSTNPDVEGDAYMPAYGGDN